ncbi:MAG: hypothetical protein ACMZ63_07775 [Methylotenera sp.]|jgi:hypothetical protein
MIEVLTPSALWELIKNASRWLVNLRRASKARQLESITALRKVLLAARKTTVYLRQLDDTKKRDYSREAELTTLWTELSFALEDLNVPKLAKRCSINGKQWADPKSMNNDFLDKADAGLERIEQLANQLLAQLK